MEVQEYTAVFRDLHVMLQLTARFDADVEKARELSASSRAAAFRNVTPYGFGGVDGLSA